MPETSETAPVCYRVEGRVATITLNRPDRRNVLSTELLNSLGDLLLRAEAEPDLRAVVLTGSGSAFCAGRDLKEARGPTPSEALRHNLAEIFELMATGRRPIIARIAGHCMGGGVGLAAACDISIAIDSARFGFSEARIGVAPAVISVVCLRKMRLSDAAELFLTGRSITAATAAHVGLINRSVEPGMLDGCVGAVLADIERCGPNALAACKRLLREVPATAPSEALAWTSALSDELFASEEAAEGMAAFLERRDPVWARALGEAR